MSSNKPTSPARVKILWDTSTDDGFHAVMFNDNGVWFAYRWKVSLNRLKVVIREISRNIPIKAVKIRPVSEIGTNSCEYTFVYTSNDVLISRKIKKQDEDKSRCRVLSNKELASLLGNPSRLLADYWDELYEPPVKYNMHLNWEDGESDRIPDLKSFGSINRSVKNGVYKGTFEQIDGNTGVSLRCEWSALPEIESAIKRALWLGKGNIPDAGH